MDIITPALNCAVLSMFAFAIGFACGFMLISIRKFIDILN